MYSIASKVNTTSAQITLDARRKAYRTGSIKLGKCHLSTVSVQGGGVSTRPMMNTVRLLEIERFLKSKFGVIVPEAETRDDFVYIHDLFRAALWSRCIADLGQFKGWIRRWMPWLINNEPADAEMIARVYERFLSESKNTKTEWTMSPADKTAKWIGIRMFERSALKITTIGACDISKQERTSIQMESRKAKARERMARLRAKRRDPFKKTISEIKPWEDLGVSRATWYRTRKEGKIMDETKEVLTQYATHKDANTEISQKKIAEEYGDGVRSKRLSIFRKEQPKPVTSSPIIVKKEQKTARPPVKERNVLRPVSCKKPSSPKIKTPPVPRIATFWANIGPTGYTVRFYQSKGKAGVLHDQHALAKCLGMSLADARKAYPRKIPLVWSMNSKGLSKKVALAHPTAALALLMAAKDAGNPTAGECQDQFGRAWHEALSTIMTPGAPPKVYTNSPS